MNMTCAQQVVYNHHGYLCGFMENTVTCDKAKGTREGKKCFQTHKR